MLGKEINIVDFQKLYPNAVFSNEKFYEENQSSIWQTDFNLVKSLLSIELDGRIFSWFGIGYNLADANQTVINKAAKFLKL